MAITRGRDTGRGRGRIADGLVRRIALAGALATGFAALACLDSIGQGTHPSADAAGSDAAATAGPASSPDRPSPGGWSETERALLRSLSIDALPAVPKDPSNRVADDPDAARLGHRLFFDARLSSNGRVACASCHEPERFFTDGRTVSQGVGETNRNAPTVVASAYAPWLFWDGRRDSLWAQALAPFESSAEMNLSRVEVVRHVARDEELARLYRAVFGRDPIEGDPGRLPPRASPFGDPATQDAWFRLPAADREAIDRAFSDLGKALAAYQRRLVPGPGRFDRYVRSLEAPAASAGSEPTDADGLDPLERQGLALFLDSGRTQCLRCHNGALLTNQAFHRVGTEFMAGGFPEFGRFLGIQAALIDPFNCLGAFSDAKPEDCRELRFLRRDHVQAESGKFKTPTLRGLSRSAPYMHDGRMPTLDAVVEHYRHPPPRDPDPGVAHELLPLEISDEEARALVAFLHTLDGEVAAEPRWLAAPGADETEGRSESGR